MKTLPQFHRTFTGKIVARLTRFPSLGDIEIYRTRHTQGLFQSEIKFYGESLGREWEWEIQRPMDRRHVCGGAK